MAPTAGFKIPASNNDDIDKKLDEMWINSCNQIASIEPGMTNWKQQVLPLARIKKIMKSDEAVYLETEKENNAAATGIMPDGTVVPGMPPADANAPAANAPIPPSNPRFMIASEAPILLGKACELLVKEITMRSWRHTERNRRRTLQKQDVHSAVGESEVYDFLIDIVPRIPLQGKHFVHDSATAAAQAVNSHNVVHSNVAANPPAYAAAPIPVSATSDSTLSPGGDNLQVKQEANSAAQLQMQYSMMIQQQQQLQQAGAAHQQQVQLQPVGAAGAPSTTTPTAATGQQATTPAGAEAVAGANQQIPPQMVMFMPQQLQWQAQPLPAAQQQQVQAAQAQAQQTLGGSSNVPEMNSVDHSETGHVSKQDSV